VQFDTALNAIWLVLGAFALANTLRSRHFRTRSHAPAWLHVSGVALVFATLFPYISATDDVLRIQRADQRITARHDNSRSSQADKKSSHEGGKKSSTDALIRLFEAMDTPVVCTVRKICFTLFFVALVVASVQRIVTREVIFKSGRSPPLLPAYSV
jgi:hypothetical protein